jgi:hypothetical protein
MDETGTEMPVYLPYLGIAYATPFSRIVCVGSFEFFTTHARSNWALFTKIVNWGARAMREQMRKVCFLGISNEICEPAQERLQETDVITSVRQEAKDLDGCDVVICMSDCAFANEIEGYLEAGGCLICAPSWVEGSDRWRMNSMLVKYGIGFSPSALDFGPSGSVFRMPRDGAKRCSEHMFPNLIKTFKEEIGGDLSGVDLGGLDALVMMLTYHIAVLPRQENPLLRDAVDLAFSTLESLKYEAPEGICPEPLHVVLMSFLADAIGRMPAEYFEGKDLSERFPGPQLGPARVNPQFTVSLAQTGMHSTGFYLPPGQTSDCAIDGEDTFGLSIQVGAHSESLLGSPGPWARWPVAATSVEVSGHTTKIGSMLGGIIYFVNHSPLPDIKVKLERVSPYGIFSNGRWSHPYGSAPFCEIVTEHAIFTVPSTLIDSIPNLASFLERFNQLSQAVVTFCAGSDDLLFRIVFDVHLPFHHPVFGTLMFLEYDFFEPVLIDAAPSSPLLTVLMSIGALCFPATFLLEDDQANLGMVAALLAFRDIGWSVGELDEVKEMDAAMAKFWELVSTLEKPSMVTRAIKTIQIRNSIAETDLWNALLDELTAVTHRPFIDLRQQFVRDVSDEESLSVVQ